MATADTTTRGQLQPIRQAARTVHKGRDYVRKLIEAGEVPAVKSGGSDRAPRLLVDPADVTAAMKRLSVYVPRGAKTSRRRPGSSYRGRIHPAAAAM